MLIMSLVCFWKMTRILILIDWKVYDTLEMKKCHNIIWIEERKSGSFLHCFTDVESIT